MGEWITFHDREAGLTRLAAFEKEKLIGALFVSPQPVALSREFLADALPQNHPGAARYRLLAGKSGTGKADRGAIVCACFQVGVNEIATAIAAGSCDVAAIGDALKAGTNCGSCRSDIRRMIDANPVAKAG